MYSVFVIETVQTGLTGADLYYWFVSGFGNLNHLASPHESGFDVPIIGTIVSLTVQFFFMYRIWVLSEKRRSSWFLCLLIFLVSRSYQSRAHTSHSYLSVLYCCCSGRVLRRYLCKSRLSQVISNLAHICRRLSTTTSSLEAEY